MIILRLMGGLGNQMFQYAYARMLQQVYNEELTIDITGFEYDMLRGFSLDNFDIPKEIHISSDQKLLDISFKIRMKIIDKFINYKYSENVYSSLRSCLGMYYFNGLVYYPFTKSIFKNKYINGYFQSEKYFEPIKELIKNELKVTPPPNSENLKIINEINNCNSVCVHIRRGDYLKYKSILVCNENYYLRGMDIINENVEEAKFFIFSDDIEWIKDNYIFKYPVTFIQNNNPDYEELRLMYTCKHFVISNSSFSWWAQYLSQNSEKIVVAPDHWFTDGRKTDIYLDWWKIVKV